MSDKTIVYPLPLNMQYGTVSAARKVPSYKFMVIDTGVYELYFLCVILQLCHQCLQSYLQFKKNTARVKVYPFMYHSGAVLFSSSPPSSMRSLRPTSELMRLLRAVPMLLETPIQICY